MPSLLYSHLLRAIIFEMDILLPQELDDFLPESGSSFCKRLAFWTSAMLTMSANPRLALLLFLLEALEDFLTAEGLDFLVGSFPAVRQFVSLIFILGFIPPGNNIFAPPLGDGEVGPDLLSTSFSSWMIAGVSSEMVGKDDLGLDLGLVTFPCQVFIFATLIPSGTSLLFLVSPQVEIGLTIEMCVSLLPCLESPWFEGSLSCGRCCFSFMLDPPSPPIGDWTKVFRFSMRGWDGSKSLLVLCLPWGEHDLTLSGPCLESCTLSGVCEEILMPEWAVLALCLSLSARIWATCNKQNKNF